MSEPSMGPVSRVKPAAARQVARRTGKGSLVAATGLALFVSLAPMSLDSLRAQIGTPVIDFHLADDEGRPHSPADYAGKIVVLEFWSFKCPPAAAYDERVTALDTKYRNRGVVVLAVDSNKNELAAEVHLNRNNRQLSFPVLIDQDGNLAESLGATHTPSVFILDRNGVLRYRGAIDNNKRPGISGRVAYVEEALDAMLSGQPVPQPETKMSGGCSIKR